MGCKTCSAQQCVAYAARNSRCRHGDGSVMWSPRYNRWWGCRCCAAPNGRKLHVNGNWQLWVGGSYKSTGRGALKLQANPGGYKYCSKYGRNGYTSQASLRACKALCKGCYGITYYSASARVSSWRRRCYVFKSASACGRLVSYRDTKGYKAATYVSAGTLRSRARVRARRSSSRRARLIQRGRSCNRQAAYLGKRFGSPQQCLTAALRNRRCLAGTRQIMWAPRYNRWWGCRCCLRSQPARRNRNWSLYG